MNVADTMSISEKIKKNNKKTDKRWLVINVLVVMCFAFATMFLGVYSGVRSITDTTLFADKVTIDGHKMGGMTYDEGVNLILNEQNEKLGKIRVVVIYNGHEGTFGANELGIYSDAEAILRQAYTHDKQGNLFENLERKYETVNLKTQLLVDEAKLQESVMEFLQQYYTTPEGDEDSETITYTDGSMVITADVQEVIKQILMRVYNEDNTPVIVN